MLKNMNEEINTLSQNTNELLKRLKNADNISFDMSHSEEKIFKKGCENIDLMYKIMDMKGNFPTRLFKFFSIFVVVPTLLFRNWVRGKRSTTIEKALDIYLRIWHELDFIQIKEKDEKSVYVHMFYLKKA